MRCSFWQIPAMIFHQKQKIYWRDEQNQPERGRLWERGPERKTAGEKRVYENRRGKKPHQIGI